MTDTLHPQSAALLARLPAPPKAFTPEGARAGHEAMTQWVCGPKPEVAEVADLVVPAGLYAGLRSPRGEAFDAAGCPAIPLRRFVPRPGADRAIVYLHGGGWVQGTLDTYDTLCRQLALACDAQVFSVGYRLSPESRFPGAIVDSVRALRFVCDEAARFGVDPAKIVVSGDSAGGHLAVTAARWLKAAGLPLPAGMALVYPVADRRLDSGSVKAFGEGFYLSRAQMAWYWEQFLGDTAIEPTHPDLSPALAGDLAGLPPSLVITAGCDILRDEGEALAKRLTEQGAPAEVLRMPGMLHGFIRFGAVIDDAASAVAAISDATRRWCA
ncbi:alpha/beta hydrolase [Burkholderiaceae bacterium FT117]|uniref:alpha/beta hydrolase n=1 Tax=Zeimonas sediminis TaxID=2944268 RepID=UPI002342BF97|nr:alpha/beta hydrolase [Zeimonas sediminis]MCM5572064.1 alpha/beta hydrolase [Zeimonas sediminis]